MNKIHKDLSERHAWYANWHANPSHTVIHFLILITFASLSGYALVSEANQAEAAPSQAVSHAPVSAIGLTTQLLKESKSGSDISSLASQRKQAMLKLATNDPRGFLLSSIPNTVRSKLPASVQLLIEKETDVQGIVAVVHIDRQETKQSEFDYQLKDNTGKLYHMRFAEGKPMLTTGSKVSAHGTVLDDQLVVAYAGGSSVKTTQAATASAAIGVQKSIVIPVNFTDNTSQPYSQTQINDIVFGPSNSLNQYYQEDSFGQTSFSGDVAPWFTVPYTASTVCNDYYTVMSAADQAAATAGYAVSNYTRRIYVIPNAGCNFGGLSVVGVNPSWSLAIMYGQPSFVEVLEHELGHALGQYHASTISCGSKAIDVYTNCANVEYGENYDPLGYYNQDHSNAAHKSLFGWLAAANVVNVSTSGTYSIAPIELKTSAPQVLKIAKSDTGESYFVGYRQPIGHDADLPPTLTSGATVHIGSIGNTYFVDLTPGDNNFANGALVDGTSFNDPNNGIQVTQVSHTDSSTVLAVQLSGAPCIPKLPTMTISPLSQGGFAGSALSYTVSLKNNDSSTCSTSTFSLGGTLPAGWSSTLSPVSLSLAPGGSGSSVVKIISPTSSTDGVYQVLVQAQDGTAAHTLSTTASYIVYAPDTVAPAVTITSPTNGTQVKGNQSVTISASASDNLSGIAFIVIKVDDATKQTCNNTTSCSYTWQGKAITPGSHTIAVTASDKSGNSKTVSAIITK
ncbi:hypothetical protein KW798_00155 [Candidatus Parcubacteria bacterium]|nr:hypothetical protein [Candidatus Parcubacteria bacterium]